MTTDTKGSMTGWDCSAQGHRVQMHPTSEDFGVCGDCGAEDRTDLLRVRTLSGLGGTVGRDEGRWVQVAWDDGVVAMAQADLLIWAGERRV